MAKTISFAEAKAHRTKDVPIYKIFLNPEDMGLSLTPDEMGLDENGKPNKTIELKFRPFSRDEYNDLLEALKDEKGTNWVDEKDFEILMLCLVDPEVPNNAEGRKFLEGWLPGVLRNVANQIEENSGYRRGYLVERVDGQKATDAIKNSASATPTPGSSSK